jgi:hypothetical protein
MVLDKMGKLKALLNETETWPLRYTFKFIVPTDKIKMLREKVQAKSYEEKPSKTGKYVSFTYVDEFDRADDILDVYHRVSDIPGIISL